MNKSTMDEIHKIKLDLVKERVKGMVDVDEIRKIIEDVYSKPLRKILQNFNCEESKEYLEQLKQGKCDGEILCNLGRPKLVGISCEEAAELIERLKGGL